MGKAHAIFANISRLLLIADSTNTNNAIIDTHVSSNSKDNPEQVKRIRKSKVWMNSLTWEKNPSKIK